MTRVLYVSEDFTKPAEVRDTNGYEDLFHLVGGSLTGISTADPEADGWYAYGNDDSIGAGLRFNSRATFLARSLGYPMRDVFFGAVVFTGPGDDQGEDTDVTDAVIGKAGELGMQILMATGALVQRES